MKKQIYLYVGIAIIFLAIGFFVGRSGSEIITKVEYVKGETIRDTIYTEEQVPYEVKVPANPILPMKPDTIRIPGKPDIRYMKVDTAQIIADYIKENSYTNTLFDDDTRGLLVVDTKVQYNKLKRLGFEFTPINKVVTKEKIRTITPFIQGSYNTIGYAGAGGGFYYHNIGVGYKYMKNLKPIVGIPDTGHEFSLSYKF